MSRTNKIIVLLSLIVFFTAGMSIAQENANSSFQQANEAYSRGDYDEAIAIYEKITETAGYSPSVLLNLANSYAQAGQIGKAVLNYERGLRLAPSDSDISGNLELIRKESGLFPKEIPGIEKYLKLLGLNQWTILILLSLVFATLFTLYSLRFRVSKQLGYSVGASCLLMLCLASAATAYHYQYYNPSVVISSDGRLFISPFDSATSIGAIQEGRLVYPLKIHGRFTYIEDETSRKGWIPTASIEPVSSPPSTEP